MLKNTGMTLNYDSEQERITDLGKLSWMTACPFSLGPK